MYGDRCRSAGLVDHWHARWKPVNRHGKRARFCQREAAGCKSSSAANSGAPMRVVNVIRY